MPFRQYRQRILALLACALPLAAWAQMAGKPANVHLIWMGGNDCPPCVAWRAQELPKLERTEVFRSITFSYVPKTIKSSVPPAFFLPEIVKPLKGKLDAASARRPGSPQAAVVVNGEVYDYFFGARSAQDMEQMLRAARDGGKYPFPRCLRLDAASSRRCALQG